MVQKKNRHTEAVRRRGKEIGPLQQRGNGKDVDADRIVLCNSNAPSCTTFVSLAREYKQQEKVLQKQNYQDSKGNMKEPFSRKHASRNSFDRDSKSYYSKHEKTRVKIHQW